MFTAFRLRPPARMPRDLPDRPVPGPQPMATPRAPPRAAAAAPSPPGRRALTGQGVSASGQALQQEGAVVRQHVGLQRQEAVLAHECGPQVGHRGLLQGVVLLGGEGRAQVAGFSAQEALVPVGTEVSPVPTAVGAAGLGDGQVHTCGGKRREVTSGSSGRQRDRLRSRGHPLTTQLLVRFHPSCPPGLPSPRDTVTSQPRPQAGEGPLQAPGQGPDPRPPAKPPSEPRLPHTKGLTHGSLAGGRGSAQKGRCPGRALDTPRTERWLAGAPLNPASRANAEAPHLPGPV